MKNKYLNIEQVKYLPESIKSAADKTEHIIKDPSKRSVITDGVATVAQPWPSLPPADLIPKAYLTLYNTPKSGEALPLAALAPIIISLLPTIIEKVPDAIDGIKRVLSGSAFTGFGLNDSEENILEAMELLESKGFTISAQ